MTLKKLEMRDAHCAKGNRSVLWLFCGMLFSIFWFSSGCANGSKFYSSNPFPDIKKVAVMPFFVLDERGNMNGLDIAEVFASELVKFRGFEVIRPILTFQKASEHSISLDVTDEKIVDRLIEFGKLLKVDAVVVGMVTEFEPYYPRKKIGLAVQMVRVHESGLASSDITRILSAGRPIAVKKENAKQFAVSFEKIFDSDDFRFRNELRSYAKYYSADDSVYKGEEVFLRITPKFVQFASNSLIRELIDIELNRREIVE